MTLRLLLFTAFLISSGAVLKADPITVRSGEHAAFTRLVIALPQGSEWQLENLNGRSRLTLSGFSDGFDISRSFDIIPRTRLSDLISRPSTLEMQLRCDCPINTFIERDRYLVMDILDGPEISAENRLELFSSQLPISEFGFGELLWDSEGARAEESSRNEGAVENHKSVSEASSNSRKANEAELFSQTEENLLKAFSRAASRGVLQLQEGISIEPSKPEIRVPDADIYDSSSTQASKETPETSNIRITDSRDLPSDPMPESLSLYGSPCADPDLVDIRSWGTDEGFNEQIARSNENLFDEMGRARPERVKERVKLYLFFGFGAEARQTLDLLSRSRELEPELMDLASILEYGSAKNPKSLHRFASCDSDLALWSILAGREMPMEIAINAPAALRGLQRLPPHLRKIVAKELSGRLLDRGDAESARIAMRIHEELTDGGKNQPNLNDAKESKSREEKGETNEILSEIISRDLPEAPGALSILVDSMISMDEDIPADIILLAEAFAFENRTEESGLEYYRTFVRAVAASGQFEKAFEALRNPADDTPRSITRDLVGFVVSELSTEASDSVFLSHYFAEYIFFESELGEEEQLEVALRLIDTGFLEEAKKVLGSTDHNHRNATKKLVSAELLLNEGAFEESLTEIVGIEGGRAARIRGEALQGLGKNEAAADNFREAEMPERAISALWLSDNWTTFIEEDTPVFGLLSTVANDGAPEITVENDMLATSLSAIANSTAARSSIRSGLEALEVSE